MVEELYVMVKMNKDGRWEYVLDSQRRLTIYQSKEQLKKYAYKYKDKSKNYRVAIYSIDSGNYKIEDVINNNRWGMLSDRIPL